MPEQPDFYTEENGDASKVTPFVSETDTKSAAQKPAGLATSNGDLQSIYNEVNFMKEILKDKEIEGFLSGEWKCLGKVIQRLMFWVSTVAFCIALIIIYA